MYSVAICDTPGPDLEEMKVMTERLLQSAYIPGEVSIFSSGKELLAAVGETRFHLLILNGGMEKLNGRQLTAGLLMQAEKTAVIFTAPSPDINGPNTALAPVLWLTKPLTEETLKKALLHCYDAYATRKALRILTTKGPIKLAPSNLVYAEAWDNGCRLELTNGVYESQVKLATLSNRLLGREFMLCHRSYLVNLRFVKRLRENDLVLSFGHSLIPVSKYRFNEVKKRLSEYLDA